MHIDTNHLWRCVYWLLAAVAFSSVTGCTITDKKVKTSVLSEPEPIESFILMDDSRYFGRFAAALAKEGFTLRPIATSAIRSEQSDPTSRRTFAEAGDRYALQIELTATTQVCMFSDNRLYNGTLTVLDLQENIPLLYLEARGPDGECPPLTPIWDLLAQALRENIPE